MSSEYHKIQAVFLRDPETKFKTLLQGQYARPEFEYLKDVPWLWEEKMDGTNIRVMWDGSSVTFGGKTDRADIPRPLLAHLEATFTGGKMSGKFGAEGGVTLYGEGCGPKIQKGGGLYFDSPQFVLFDVRAGNWWLRREDVDDVAKSLSIEKAPLIMTATIGDALGMVFSGFDSRFNAPGVDSHPAEGLVGRPLVELMGRDGQRVITKIKSRDFA